MDCAYRFELKLIHFKFVKGRSRDLRSYFSNDVQDWVKILNKTVFY